MSVQAGPNSVESGLVLCLDAGNLKSYSGSGTIWTDLNNNGKNGTLSQSPTFSNNAITLSPTILTIGNTNNSMYCCEFWINLQSTITNSTAATQFFTYDNNSQGYCSFGAATGFVTGETLTFISYNGSIYYRTAIKDNIDAGWNHIVFNWENTNYQFYINNSKKTMYNGDGDLYAHVPLINLNNFIVHFGVISSVKVYNRALTPAEVQQNFNALRGRFGI